MPDETPLVFLTGYKISYTPGSSAIPLFKSPEKRLEGTALTYKSTSAQFIRSDLAHHHEIPNFIPPPFYPAGHKFTQLTPDGPLR